MKLLLALIEDKAEHRECFEQALQRYRIFHPEDQIECRMITSGSAFELVLKDSARIHAFFLDIELAGLLGKDDGLSIAKRLRASLYTGELIFLSSYREYVFDGYGLEALSYLIKPCSADALAPILDRVKERCRHKTWFYQAEGRTLAIPYRQIIYFSVERHKISVISASETFVFRASLKELSLSLPLCFCFCHRSFLVNMDHVVCVRRESLQLADGQELPVSRAYYKGLIEYLNRSF